MGASASSLQKQLSAVQFSSATCPDSIAPTDCLSGPIRVGQPPKVGPVTRETGALPILPRFPARSEFAFCCHVSHNLFQLIFTQHKRWFQQIHHKKYISIILEYTSRNGKMKNWKLGFKWIIIQKIAYLVLLSLTPNWLIEITIPPLPRGYIYVWKQNQQPKTRLWKIHSTETHGTTSIQNTRWKIASNTKVTCTYTVKIVCFDILYFQVHNIRFLKAVNLWNQALLERIVSIVHGEGCFLCRNLNLINGQPVTSQ